MSHIFDDFDTETCPEEFYEESGREFDLHEEPEVQEEDEACRDYDYDEPPYTYGDEPLYTYGDDYQYDRLGYEDSDLWHEM